MLYVSFRVSELIRLGFATLLVVRARVRLEIELGIGLGLWIGLVARIGDRFRLKFG